MATIAPWGGSAIVGGLRRDQDVTWVFSERDGADNQVSLIHEGHRDRQVFAAMNGEVDLIGEQGLFEFLDEEALAAAVEKGAVGDLVAGGLNADGQDLQIRVRKSEIAGDEGGLSLGEERGSGAKTEDGHASILAGIWLKECS